MTALEQAPASERLYFSERGLYPFQVEGVVYCYERPDNLAIWDTGIGKALAHGQRVATPSGWRTIESLTVGDEVFGSDGLPHRVVGVYPQGERPLYRVGFTDGAEVICDEDHLWSVNTRKRKWMGDPDKVMSLAEIMASGLRLSDGWKHYVPVSDSVDYGVADLPIDPYTLGALIGDGGLTQPALRITTMDPDMIDFLVLPEGVVAKPQRAKSLATTWLLTSGRGVPNPLLSAIRDLGLACKSEFKRIPEIYLRASIEQRWALLQGLLDTDGYCGTSIEFYSSSVGLGEDVAELARSLGGTASITIKETGSLPCSVVRMVLPPERCPFRIQRKASLWRPRRRPTRAICSIEPVMAGLATCIAVDAPDSLFLTEGYVVTHNTHLAMATSAMLFEDDLIDHVLVVCERNKVDEWLADYAKFTALAAAKYHGDVKRRAKIREALPQVVVSTYETTRNDIGKLITVPKRKTKKLVPHVLAEVLTGRRVMVVYDEITKLGNRGSGLHKAHSLLISELRKAAPTRVLGLTATPIERDVENIFNIGRILTPATMPTVADFESLYVKGRDIFGKATGFKNLSTEDHEEPWVPTFRKRLAPVLLRKRKTDPDVIDQFPKTVEEITYVPLTSGQRDFYDTVLDAFTADREEAEVVPGLWTTLRMIAAHPMALMGAQGDISRAIAGQVGSAGLRALGSGKTDRLIEYLEPLVLGQGAQAVVFSFFGPTVLPLLKTGLEAAGIRCAVNHGQMTDGDRAQQKTDFRAGKYHVFLTSDAGARGINLPEATYACVDATTPVLTEELRWVPAGSLREGDQLLTGDEYPSGGGREGSRKWRRGTVVRNRVEARECLKVTLTNGDSMTVTPDHLMYVETRKGIREWRRADEVRLGWTCPRYLDVWETEDTFEGGWVSGLFDGEGWCAPIKRGQALGVAQNPGLVLDRILSIMEKSKFQYAHHAYAAAKIERVMILGGRAEQARFLGTYQVARLIPKWTDYVVGRMMNAIESPRILSVEQVGVRDVAVMETTTRTFVADGYLQHNCEYEMSLTHANRTQRLNRIHRIDSAAPSVTFQTFVAAETVEDGIARGVMERNRWSDTLLDDDDPGEHFMSAADRRRLLSRAKRAMG